MSRRAFSLLLLMVLLSGGRAAASHYRGGEISYRFMGRSPSSGEDIYEFTFRIYSECGHGDANAIRQDFPLYYAVFDGAGTRQFIDTTLDGAYQPLPLNAVSGCYRDTVRYCASYAVLKRTVALPANASGYTIVNQRCCLGGDVSNLVASGENGLTLLCAMPGSAVLPSGAGNSSPTFRTLPPLRLCINGSFGIDFGAADADGDSLAYRFVSGLMGGTATNAKPIPTGTTPAPLAYAPFCSYTQPLGGSGTVALDAATGMLTGRCGKAGEYLICVACDEYRGGIRIGTVTRAYVLQFADCNEEATAQVARDAAAVIAGIDSLTIVRCGGSRTVRFQNTSTGATAFHWDFGVAAAADDTSALRDPQFTYPAPGRHQLTLIAYGANCADTLHGAVWLSDDELHPDFIIEGRTCLLDTVVLRDASTAVSPASIVQWSWRTGGGESAGGSAIGLILAQQGPLVVSHSIVSVNGCVASVDKTIDVRQAPISGGNDTVVAIDLELMLTASGGVSYNWEALPPGTLNGYVPGSPTAYPQTSVYGKDFMYIVTGRDAQGCGGRDTVRVTVSEQSYIFVPSAFSPNGDTKNDVLRAYVSGGNVLLFSVYNRRGNLVFSTTDPHEGWDGRHKGEEAAMDVYFWMLKIQSGYSGHELIYSGDVTLVR